MDNQQNFLVIQKEEQRRIKIKRFPYKCSSLICLFSFNVTATSLHSIINSSFPKIMKRKQSFNFYKLLLISQILLNLGDCDIPAFAMQISKQYQQPSQISPKYSSKIPLVQQSLRHLMIYCRRGCIRSDPIMSFSNTRVSSIIKLHHSQSPKVFPQGLSTLELSTQDDPYKNEILKQKTTQQQDIASQRQNPRIIGQRYESMASLTLEKQVKKKVTSTIKYQNPLRECKIIELTKDIQFNPIKQQLRIKLLLKRGKPKRSHTWITTMPDKGDNMQCAMKVVQVSITHPLSQSSKNAKRGKGGSEILKFHSF
ncbi:hypothetical protein ABPG73_021738 [Tetrahymena malaccensis]